MVIPRGMEGWCFQEGFSWMFKECHMFFDRFFSIGMFEQTSMYPLVICYIAMENDPVEIADFPMNHGDFP